MPDHEACTSNVVIQHCNCCNVLHLAELQYCYTPPALLPFSSSEVAAQPVSPPRLKMQLWCKHMHVEILIQSQSAFDLRPFFTALRLLFSSLRLVLSAFTREATRFFCCSEGSFWSMSDEVKTSVCNSKLHVRCSWTIGDKMAKHLTLERQSSTF